jgi:hypothetical protein
MFYDNCLGRFAFGKILCGEYMPGVEHVTICGYCLGSLDCGKFYVVNTCRGGACDVLRVLLGKFRLWQNFMR